MQKPGDVIDLAEQEQRYTERQFFASLAERTELDAAFNRGFAIGFLRVLEEDFKMSKKKAKAEALDELIERGISLADAKEILAAL